MASVISINNDVKETDILDDDEDEYYQEEAGNRTDLAPNGQPGGESFILIKYFGASSAIIDRQCGVGEGV